MCVSIRGAFCVLVLSLVGFSISFAEENSHIKPEDRKYWAYIPVKDPAIPKSPENKWSEHPIDSFIFRKLSSNGLTPTEPANKRDLIRRAYFDLVGFPPTAEEVEVFVKDTKPDAYEKVIDKLLASPHYGERWARHWLDLVRYAESDGYRGDFYRPTAYLYRDYVIRSFNKDKPYPKFVMEQLAGDEYAPEDPDALIATHYFRLPIYQWSQRDVITHWDIILEDITDVTADVFLGSGLQCAKCHDHKFDPILQKDYFALRAFFAPMIWKDDVSIATPEELKKKATWEKANKAAIDKLAEIEAPARKKSYWKIIRQFPEDIQKIMEKPEGERSNYEKQMAYLTMRQAYHEWNNSKGKKEIHKEHKALIDKLKKTKPKLQTGMTAADLPGIPPQTKLPGKNEDIHPGFMTVLYPKGADVNAKIVKPAKAPKSSGRRMALAKWIGDPDNPITTRVIVNRIWQYHFGRGLAINPNDFGKLGNAPTHPELLDWMVKRFIDFGWKFKPMHKMIMMSKTYQQSTKHKNISMAMKIDPENKYLWKMSGRRHQAEVIRDSMLFVSGELKQRSKGGRSVSGTSPERSIYVKVIRNVKDEFLNAFDWADAFASNAVRNVTTTPVQSLMMLNGTWVMKRSKSLAGKSIKAYKNDSQSIIKYVYDRAYGRHPNEQEFKSALEFIDYQKDAYISRDKELAADQNYLTRMNNGLNAITSKGRRNFYKVLTKDVEMLTQGNFTIETKIQMNSIQNSSQIRVIASQSTKGKDGLSWALGVTGQKSRYSPGRIFLRLRKNGKNEDIVSDLSLKVNTPYYLGVIASSSSSQTKVKFFLKDYSKKDSELNNYQTNIKTVLNQVTDDKGSIVMFTDNIQESWDGMIGEVRLSRTALDIKDLMVGKNLGDQKNTIAHWHFASDEELLKDATKNGYHLQLLRKKKLSESEAQLKAVSDFCQVIFNSSEFLYQR
ncbi:MAG: DUF1549 and DUF1553 domain-containing protein [Lentisphaeraceae bacterium]|nr:DUF1549 and DUF1553 domain-containing protein [Lentisphaeraceae bacterium]